LPITCESYFKSLKTLAFALIIGQSIFLFTSMYINFSKNKQGLDFDKIIFSILIISLITVSYVLGRFLFDNQIKQVYENDKLYEKLQKYQTAIILQFALIEFGGLFSTVCYFLSNEMIFAFLSLVPILLSVVHFPSKSKLINVLNLSSKEVDILEDGNYVL
ncbi:MAG: hypothetical protein RLZZ175_2191, partial [Bacteroidota bacterium]